MTNLASAAAKVEGHAGPATLAELAAKLKGDFGAATPEAVADWIARQDCALYLYPGRLEGTIDLDAPAIDGAGVQLFANAKGMALGYVVGDQKRLELDDDTAATLRAALAVVAGDTVKAITAPAADLAAKAKAPAPSGRLAQLAGHLEGDLPLKDYQLPQLVSWIAKNAEDLRFTITAGGDYVAGCFTIPAPAPLDMAMLDVGSVGAGHDNTIKAIVGADSVGVAMPTRLAAALDVALEAYYYTRTAPASPGASKWARRVAEAYGNGPLMDMVDTARGAKL